MENPIACTTRIVIWHQPVIESTTRFCGSLSHMRTKCVELTDVHALLPLSSVRI